jgi:hypothetical protein
MSLPKPTEENIALSQEDMKYTQDLRNLTLSIDKELKAHEDEISRFLAHFEAFRHWMMHNTDSAKDFKRVILEKIDMLKDHTDKSVMILGNIKEMTVSEQKIDSKKLMISIEVAGEFEAQERFMKELHYPHGVAGLAKDVAKLFSTTRDEIREDLNLESKTEELISRVVEMMKNIRVWLISLQRLVEGATDFSAIQQ